MLDFSDGQHDTLAYTALGSSLLSAVGATYIITRYFRAQKLFNDDMVLGLAVLNLLEAIGFGLSPLTSHADSQTALCVAQGLSIQVFGLASVIWTCGIALSLALFLVRGRSPQQIAPYKAAMGVISLVVAVVAAASIYSDDGYGPAGPWCWVTHPSQQFLLFWLWVVVAWVINSIILLAVISEAFKRLSLAPTGPASQLTSRLALYMLVFIANWVCGLANRLVEAVRGEHVFALAFLHALFVPLQGFLNAIVFGSLHGDLSWVARCLPTHTVDRYARMEESPVQSAPTSSASIGVVTWNMGGAVSVTANDLHAVIPSPAPDILAIGVQECVTLPALHAAVRELLPLHSTHTIETGLGFQGFVGLVVCVRHQLIVEGIASTPTAPPGAVVNRGVNLGVARAANKGAVGLTVRIFGTQVAFLTAHLAADTGGTSKLHRRNEDVEATLRTLELDSDTTGLHLQLSRHHTFLLGDLNYRMRFEDVDTALTKIATAAASRGASGYRRVVAEYDELVNQQSCGAALSGWREMAITFPPTYRLFAGQSPIQDFTDIEQLRQGYSTSSSKDSRPRIPSYTDRVLWHSLPATAHTLTAHSYSALHSVTTSDHRPVMALFSLAADANTPFYTNPFQGAAPVTATISLSLSALAGVPNSMYTTGQPVLVRVIFPLPAENPFFDHWKLSQLSPTFHDMSGPAPHCDHTFSWDGERAHTTLTAQVPRGVAHLTLIVELLPLGVQGAVGVYLEEGASHTTSVALTRGGVQGGSVTVSVGVSVA